MPFTPLHMGPGLLLKAGLQARFSILVFGWSQIVIDLQPLYVMISGNGQLHGISHSYLGAAALAVIAAVTGKYLSELGLYVIGYNREWQTRIAWKAAFLSAALGTFSHVLLDGIMHSDMRPLSPWSQSRPWLGLVSIETLHGICLLSGLFGGLLWLFLHHQKTRRNA